MGLLGLVITVLVSFLHEFSAGAEIIIMSYCSKFRYLLVPPPVYLRGHKTDAHVKCALIG